ncbi:MAG: DUF2325 domain-containing protein [Clostridia bacterium]|nr:DUF2325 domain-containing protein [Clostridia bacterium]
MSVVIVGGNDCMVSRYKSICKEYKCKPKVFTQMSSTMKNQIGTPDLLILFTNTVSHKMVQHALSGIDETSTIVTRSHSSSANSLKNILEFHTKGGST